MKRSNIFSVILRLLILLTLLFIFSRSMASVPESIEESQKVVEIVEPVLQPIIAPQKVTINLVRKLAHFVEFGLLGLLTGLLFRKITALPFFFLLLVGLTDETIQIFSGRGPQVQDVWLDFAGSCTGFLAGLLLWLLFQKICSVKTVSFKQL